MASTTSPMYLYEMYPIDVWKGWIFIEDARNDTQKYDLNPTELEDQLDRAKHLLSKHSDWEGDGNVYISSLPFEPEAKLVFAIKQGNNGTTYIASPMPFEHLKEHQVIGSPF